MIPDERHMECAYYFDFCRLCQAPNGREAAELITQRFDLTSVQFFEDLELPLSKLECHPIRRRIYAECWCFFSGFALWAIWSESRSEQSTQPSKLTATVSLS